MKKLFFFTFSLILGYNSSIAQASNTNQSIDSEKEVKQVINNMFQAMKQADTVLLKTCFADGAIFQTILNKPDGPAIKASSVNDFIQSVGKQQANVLDERIEFGGIQIEPLMATVWTPYSFFLKGNFSHKGVNSFQLVKFKEGWKIQYIIDTRYK